VSYNSRVREKERELERERVDTHTQYVIIEIERVLERFERMRC